MRSLLVIFALFACSSLAFVVEEVCVQRAFGTLLDAEEIANLTVAFSSPNRRKTVVAYVKSLHLGNSTQKKVMHEVCNMFQSRIAFAENLARNFFKSVGKVLNDTQMAALHSRYIADLKSFNCDVTKVFGDLYSWLAEQYASDPSLQQTVQNAANKVLQRFTKTSESMSKLVKYMSYFLTPSNSSSNGNG
ncbi:unnamed protein product, partial [Mesorhabditis belari]|uniref:Uncharacterized protein n=1 Tax=Mesorhabditis belari TaxID=2138241 RepID=A0AAF3FGX6_9BILA